MSQLDNLKENLKNSALSIKQKIQESQTYGEAQERYEGLSPTGQKVALGVAVLAALFLLLFYPMTNLTSSNNFITMFEEKRTLIRDLFRTYRETSAAPAIVMPPPAPMLKSSIDRILTQAQLLPEQNIGVAEAGFEGRLIPQNLVSSIYEVKLAKLNLKQIVEIGSSLVAISESVKMKDLLVSANQQDTRYFDVTYKLYTLNVPQPEPQAVEPEVRNDQNGKKAGGNDE